MQNLATVSEIYFIIKVFAFRYFCAYVAAFLLIVKLCEKT